MIQSPVFTFFWTLYIFVVYPIYPTSLCITHWYAKRFIQFIFWHPVCLVWCKFYLRYDTDTIKTKYYYYYYYEKHVYTVPLAVPNSNLKWNSAKFRIFIHIIWHRYTNDDGRVLFMFRKDNNKTLEVYAHFQRLNTWNIYVLYLLY